MSRLVKVDPRSTALKPPHGAPCNGCGVCCLVSTCGLGLMVMGVAIEPCPALLGEPGDMRCGLVEEPRMWAPIRAGLHGPEAMSQAALAVIGAGNGCDARINGEARDRVFEARCAQHDDDKQEQLAAAKRLWVGELLCPDCGWQLPRFGCPHDGCNAVALHCFK